MVVSTPDVPIAGLEELLRAAARLPVCDGSAKLYACLTRVLDDLAHQRDARASIAALADAARAALDADPWATFEKAASQFRATATPS